MVEARPSPIHGQGLFADQAFKRGDEIISGEPMVKVVAEDLDPQGIWKAYERCSDGYKEEWNSISYSADAKEREELAASAGVPEDLRETCAIVVAKWNDNAFANMMDGSEWMVAQCWRINHSCQPNALWCVHPTNGRLEVRAVTDIAGDEEIFVSYVPQQYPRSIRRKELKRWGFKCTCALCSDREGEAEARRQEYHEICQQLLEIGDEQDLWKQRNLYNQLLAVFADEKQFEPLEDQLIWNTLVLLIISSKLDHKVGRGSLRGPKDRQIKKLTRICFGKDTSLPQKWKDDLFEISVLPPAEK